MILTPQDRQRILAAFRERIGNISLPRYTTVDDLCTNLLLAIPALVATADAAEKERHEAIDRHQADLLRMEIKVRELTKKLEEDPHDA